MKIENTQEKIKIFLKWNYPIYLIYNSNNFYKDFIIIFILTGKD